MGIAPDPEVLSRIGWISAFFLKSYQHMGPVFRYMRGGQMYSVLAGTDANQFIVREGRRVIRAEDYRREQNLELGVRSSLVSMDGEEHRRHRKIQQHGYARSALDDKYPLLVRAVRQAVDRWPRGEPILVRDALPPIVAELLGIGVLNYPLGDYYDDVVLFVRTVVIETVARTRPRTVLDTQEYGLAKARSLELADRVIAAHRETVSGLGRPDLVDDLLAACDRDPDLMTDQELRIAVLGGYVGGLDTVAYTCAFMLYALLSNPQILQRVQQEIDAALGSGTLGADTFAGMRNLHDAAMETLRLYPLSAAIQATAGATFHFGGHVIEEGQNLIVATTVPHFLKELYPDPLRFDIDRFRPPREEHCHPGAFAPFGLGPHICLGAGLATSLIMVTMSSLLHAATFAMHPPDYELKIGMIPVPVPYDFHITVS
jgi:cytochrome P450